MEKELEKQRGENDKLKKQKNSRNEDHQRQLENLKQNEDEKIKRLEKTRDERFLKYELIIEEVEKELEKQRGENDKLKKDKDAHLQDKNQEFERLKSNEQ